MKGSIGMECCKHVIIGDMIIVTLKTKLTLCKLLDP